MAYQSYLTAPHLSNQLNGLDYSFVGRTVADIGTGLGILPYLLKDKKPSKIIGVDLDKNFLNAARNLTDAENTGYINADGCNIPVKNSAFDVVFVRYVFQHINLSDIFLSEIKRIIKDGGLLVIVDIEDDMNIFYPGLPESSQKLFEVYSEYQKLKGGDRFISKKLPGFLLSHGFKDVLIKPYTLVFFKKEYESSGSEGLKNAFLLVQNELELVKDDLLCRKLIGPVEFHKGLNDYFKFLNLNDDLLISKTEFLITCKK
ncbi:MAG: class I SAM-dependent methyltransferase [bacterium]